MVDQKPEATASTDMPDLSSVLPGATASAAPAEAAAATESGWRTFARNKAGGLRQNRMALLAASVVFAAGFGVVAGALGSSAYKRSPAPPAAPAVKSVTAADLKPLADTLAQLKSEIGALKAASDATSRSANAQFSKLSERMERLDKGQAEPAARLAKLSESLDRLEQKVATVSVPKDVTGSVAPRPVANVPEPKPTILEGWRLRSVYDGAALIQGRSGLIEVEPGDTLPGGGRVERISRQDGRWVVVTSKGIILSMR